MSFEVKHRATMIAPSGVQTGGTIVTRFHPKRGGVPEHTTQIWIPDVAPVLPSFSPLTRVEPGIVQVGDTVHEIGGGPLDALALAETFVQVLHVSQVKDLRDAILRVRDAGMQEEAFALATAVDLWERAEAGYAMARRLRTLGPAKTAPEPAAVTDKSGWEFTETHEGFQCHVYPEYSVLACPCGKSYTWSGFGEHLDAWKDEHRTHLRTS